MASDLMTRDGELLAVDQSAPGIERIIARVANINVLCDAVHREILLLGRELSDCKWSGDYLLDPKWDDPKHKGKTRTWNYWLSDVSPFSLRTGNREAQIVEKVAANLMAYSSCYATLAAENRKRSAQNMLPLPLPTNHSQIEPYQGLFTRVDDWSADLEWSDDVKAVAHSNAIRDTQPPYAEDQSQFLAKWEQICATLPVDKRQTKDGLMAPPPRDFSQNYLTREREIARKEREAAEAKNEPADEEQPALVVGQEKQSDKTAASGTSTKPPKQPKKSQEELEAEAHEAALRKDIMDYRNDLHNLRVSADALEARLKNILARSGDGRLAEMRGRTDLGVYSVHDDMNLLRGAVEACQRIYRLATEPYVAPQPISRREVDPSTASVDVEAVA